jgi:hypothetical protein
MSASDTFLVADPDGEVRVVETQTIWSKADGYAPLTRDVALTLWRQAGLIGDDGYAKVVTTGAGRPYNVPTYAFADELTYYWEERFLTRWRDEEWGDADSVERFGHHYSEEAFQRHDDWYTRAWEVLDKWAPLPRSGVSGSGVEVSAA